ncbi:MAG: NAD(P)-dependent oxidoreductase [Candidatus Omnitrophica bacterium]|jgi:nucleoside-diphosphate-sugar epimerase|nr:NAD(P)-dependent oxidoreductase [Candidatus Omnitrophota bacterium]
MKILITGSKGFIGRNLVKGLSEYDVTAISRDDFDLTDYITTSKYLSDKYFDVVIHCACTGGSRLKKDDISILDQNLAMFYNLFYNKEHFGKFISFGSGAEIYKDKEPYGLSKKIIANIITKTPNFYNLRLFAVFGSDELDTRFIKANLLRYINHEDMIIHQDKLMDFFYIEDLITVVKRYLIYESLPKQINCVYKKAYTLQNICTYINELGVHKVQIRINNGAPFGHYFGIPPWLFYDTVGYNLIGWNCGIKKMYDELKKTKEKKDDFFNQIKELNEFVCRHDINRQISEEITRWIDQII